MLALKEMMKMTDIKSMTLSELKEEMALIGEKAFKAGQIYSWLHKHGAVSFDEMTNISKDSFLMMI